VISQTKPDSERRGSIDELLPAISFTDDRVKVSPQRVCMPPLVTANIR
jgi:hypothetical protein